MKPKKALKRSDSSATSDTEFETPAQKVSPAKPKAKRGPKPGKNAKNKPKRGRRKKKDEEFRIFFPPPRINPPMKTPFRLHNTKCHHVDYITKNLELPKYASYQVGWRVSQRAMRSIVLIDQKRAEFLRIFGLLKEKSVKKAVFETTRQGVASMSRMPKNWNGEVDLEDFQLKNEPIESTFIPTEPINQNRPETLEIPKNRPKISKKRAILTVTHQKSSRKPKKRRFRRLPRTKNHRMIDFCRSRNSKIRISRRIRLDEKLRRIRPRIRILRKNLIRKFECHVDLSNWKMWIWRQKLEENRTKLQWKKKLQKEAEEDEQWETYLNNKANVQHFEQIEKSAGDFSLEISQQFRFQHKEWTVVEKKGCEQQGYQYLLVLTAEKNGQRTKRYDRQNVDHKFRKMTDEKKILREFVTSLPVYKPKPPPIRYPTFAGVYEERDRELERRRQQEEARAIRDEQLEASDRMSFRKFQKRIKMITHYRNRIRHEIWKRRRRNLQNLQKTPPTDSEDELEDVKCLQKTSTSSESSESQKSKKALKNVKKSAEMPEKHVHFSEDVKSDDVTTSSDSKWTKKEVKIEEFEDERGRSLRKEHKEVKKEVKEEEEVKVEELEENMQMISVTNNRHHMSSSTPSTSSAPQKFQKPSENLKNLKNRRNRHVNNRIKLEEDEEKEIKTEIKDEQSCEKRVKFKETAEQKLSKLWKPMTWQIKEMIRTIGVGRGYKIRSKRSRRNETVRLRNRFDGVSCRFQPPPERIDEFEKGIDIREEPIPFMEEFILDDHALLTFASFDDMKRYELACSLRQEDVIEDFWRLQCEKALERVKGASEEQKSMRREINRLDEEIRIQKQNENAHIDRENSDAFETAGRRVEEIIKATGDCAFDTLEEYSSIAADFQKHAEFRKEEEATEIELDRWENELETLIAAVKKEYDIVELMMKMLVSRHRLTMRLVVSTINQSSIDRENLLKKTKKVLLALEQRRQSAIDYHKNRYERNARILEKYRALRQRVLLLGNNQKLRVKSIENRHKSMKNGLKTTGNARKTGQKLKILIKFDPETRKKVAEKMAKRRENKKKRRNFGIQDLRWRFRKFRFTNGVGKRDCRLRPNHFRRALAWGLKIEEMFQETEYERLLRTYVHFEEAEIKYQISIDRKIELIQSLQQITIESCRLKAIEIQREKVDKAVDMMIRLRMQQLTDDHRAWLRSAEFKLKVMSDFLSYQLAPADSDILTPPFHLESEMRNLKSDPEATGNLNRGEVWERGNAPSYF
ncbi:hypothetical protein L3Y34_000379 [Caenorhabditis briggsae]|uniref:Uncharacterized protein n=1 Tax=Caenorhabditis briggsae TaxID=6238 RepID=A0AAE9IMK4_CAEBR|nr:hypothetical protein L3Y34_000379 [Caenorhabditis briggsae]